jgi:hypothetical protein
MLRSSLVFSSALILCATASAQQQVQAMKVISPIRDAGTYHVATGTWTRTGNGANLGPDTIFAATAPSGYFGTGWEGAEGVDEGILPSTSNPLGGTQDCYDIDGFQFAYCSFADTTTWTINLYDGYTACDQPDAPANCLNMAGSVANMALPTGSACWMVTIDLSGGYEIGMGADGTAACAPGYQGALSGLDHFGWGAVWTTGNGGLTGPILDGYDPNWAPEGEGTCYNTNVTCFAGATGLGAQDLFGIGAPLSGCFWFGGYNNTNGCGGPSQNPGAQFTFVMFTDCAAAGNCDNVCYTTYCDTNVGDTAIDSCTVADNPLLTTTGLGAFDGQFAYHLMGVGSNVINPPGSTGDLCLGGAAIGRYNTDIGLIAGGSHTTDLVNGSIGNGNGTLPNPPGGTLTAGQTWNFTMWYRMGPGASGFADAITVSFN